MDFLEQVLRLVAKKYGKLETGDFAVVVLNDATVVVIADEGGDIRALVQGGTEILHLDITTGFWEEG